MKVTDVLVRALNTNIDLCLMKNGVVECFYVIPWSIDVSEYAKVISAYGDMTVDYIRVNQETLDIIVR